MKAFEIAKEVFPDKDDDFLEFALWEKTGFPHFWTTKEGESNEDCLRRQLMEFKEELG